MSTRSFRGTRVIRFDEFELDVRAAELRRNGERVKLQEQPFRILVMLLEHPGEVVLREDIRRKLWPNGTIVEVGHGINAAVLRLREALGDSAGNPRYVETLARRGYRFAGQAGTVSKDAEESAPPAMPACQPLASQLDTAGLAGLTIAHYRVIAKVGGGGMGVVYRAEDLRLGRHVALKFLPPELGGDPAALGRFQREARAASALNHPNICTVYGVEEYRGQPIIVMEMLEGETLESRLSKGPLAVPKALALAVQMADALDAAHRRGIVHRDLKPGNVLLTRNGVKVLDFGLAKIGGTGLTSTVGIGGGEPVTQEGAILGTLHYMSPEQVQGKEADAASDIFSFGLVLYEMLSGKRAFPGENSASVMAAILTGDPLELREPIAPAGLDRILWRCLAKEPGERWQTASDLKAALELIAARGTEDRLWPAVSPPVAQPAGPPSSRRRYWIAAFLLFAAIVPSLVWSALSDRWERMHATLLLTSAARPAASALPEPLSPDAAPASAAARQPAGGTASPAVTRFTVWPPGDGNVTRLSLSPDGHSVAFLSGGRIFVRAFDSLDPRALDNTEGAGTPFWSPDGRSIAFAANGELKTIRADGSEPPVPICKVNTNIRGAWGKDGSILIGMIGDGIFRVTLAAKRVSQVTRIDPGREETRHLLPQFLPDGRRFLFVAGAHRAEKDMLYAGSLDSSERTPIMAVSSGVEFVSSREFAASRSANPPGYLIFADHRTLMAQAFDPVKLRTTGSAFPVAGAIASVVAAGADLGVGDFSATGGTLAYRSAGVPENPGGSPMGNLLPTRGARKDVGNIIVVQNWIAGVKR